VGRGLIIFAAALVALIGARTAQAGTASADVTEVAYTAPAGETNHVTLTQDSSGVTVHDDGAAVVAGTGCQPVSANEAFCARQPMKRRVRAIVALADLDDHAQLVGFFSFRTAMYGGDGADTLIGDSGDELLGGGPGNDTLMGGKGDDRLDGDAGDDVMDGGPGDGDFADYYGRPTSVHVDLRIGVGREAGENDSLIAVEGAWGGQAADTFIGDEGPNFFLGFHGNDLVKGRGGDDYLNGHQDRDLIYGGRGNDRLEGFRGEDTLYGGWGDDLIHGDGKADILIGGDGNDRLYGDDGYDTFRARDSKADVIRGGRGQDRARIDRGLDSARDVETFL
jgi:Ca2+-binding RTX toxin-like protein